MQALVDALEQMGVLTASATEGATAMIAAGYTITIPDLPPAGWFEEPAEEPEIGGLTVTADGQVFGWLAPAGVTHRGFRGQRNVYVPQQLDLSEYMNKTVLTDGGDGRAVRLAAGNITMNCGHAGPEDPRRADPGWATEHYENSCSLVARARVGYAADGGLWIAGSLLPDVTWPQVSRMMGCELSLDCQGGKLKAALMVPVGGFPRAQHKATVRIVDGALVASAVPVHFQPRPRAGRADLRPVLEAIARRHGLDAASKLARLRARHPKTEEATTS
jgi:hypothetical protein